MPLVRSTITLQNPQSDLPNIRSSMREIHRKYGLGGLWHGTSAGILKTVPKYCTAVYIKDFMERTLPMPTSDPDSATYRNECLVRSACKSVVAGIAGAALTNPLDVIRNEMFKTNQGLVDTVKGLHEKMGYNFMFRGMGKNLIAVSIPVASTIFFTDVLIQMTSAKKV
eukprot:CAMPEP_0116007192 /NCGR_PEP_ID=MMETSP0321-20121206/2151_1 /TAXON_ID=163516 /ORGANISM="Leptocylindrus danicus var. danicus, Strain B650" /LENGTH=167 /DNA_ID=CAMNT_0003475837 /DNA_START=349 /DNA_END=852 /DNA_ORIENTATION=+